jgi:hypothetical protein
MIVDSVVTIVDHIPRQYERQQGLTCGEQNVRTIIAGFDLPFYALTQPPLRVKLLGFSFLKDIQRLLKTNGLSAPIRHASRLDAAGKLRTLTDHIDRGEPVLLAIGNGHLSRERYVPLARFFIGHFITVYGYHARHEVFYIYDSYLKGAYQEDLPAGNEVRTFQEILRDWQGPFYYRFIGMDHVYLPVSHTLSASDR